MSKSINYNEVIFINADDVCYDDFDDPIDQRVYDNDYHVRIHSHCAGFDPTVVYKCCDCERLFIKVADNYHDERLDYLCPECE